MSDEEIIELEAWRKTVDLGLLVFKFPNIKPSTLRYQLVRHMDSEPCAAGETIVDAVNAYLKENSRFISSERG